MALIGLLGDVHATPAPVAEALSIFREAGVDEVFCAGDIAGYRDDLEETIDLLERDRVRAIVGNHDLLYLDHFGDEPGDRAAAYLERLPAAVDVSIEGRQVYMVHAEPLFACHGGIKLRDRSGEVQPDRVAHWSGRLQEYSFDVLIVGHTHQVFAEQAGATLVVNPGSSAFNHSCAILRLPEMSVEFFPLSGKPIANTWNWSEHVLGNKRREARGP